MDPAADPVRPMDLADERGRGHQRRLDPAAGRRRRKEGFVGGSLAALGTQRRPPGGPDVRRLSPAGGGAAGVGAGPRVAGGGPDVGVLLRQAGQDGCQRLRLVRGAPGSGQAALERVSSQVCQTVVEIKILRILYKGPGTSH